MHSHVLNEQLKNIQLKLHTDLRAIIANKAFG